MNQDNISTINYLNNPPTFKVNSLFKRKNDNNK